LSISALTSDIIGERREDIVIRKEEEEKIYSFILT